MDIKDIVLSDKQTTKFPIPTLMRLLGSMSSIQTLKHSYIQELCSLKQRLITIHLIP